MMALTVPVHAAVRINKTKVTFCTGMTTQLKITGTKAKVKWSSSNKAVASVNSKGKVTAKKKGNAVITAKVGKKSYKCKIVVKDKIKVKGSVKATGSINDYGVKITVKNTIVYPKDVTVTCTFYYKGEEVERFSDDLYVPGSGGTAVTQMFADDFKWDKYKIKLELH